MKVISVWFSKVEVQAGPRVCGCRARSGGDERRRRPRRHGPPRPPLAEPVGGPQAWERFLLALRDRQGANGDREG